jgi:hypothetical protein
MSPHHQLLTPLVCNGNLVSAELAQPDVLRLQSSYMTSACLLLNLDQQQARQSLQESTHQLDQHNLNRHAAHPRIAQSGSGAA